jgi:hypothetical protein
VTFQWVTGDEVKKNSSPPRVARCDPNISNSRSLSLPHLAAAEREAYSDQGNIYIQYFCFCQDKIATLMAITVDGRAPPSWPAIHAAGLRDRFVDPDNLSASIA